MRLALAASERDFEILAVADVPGDGHDSWFAAEFDARTLHFHPQSAVITVDQLQFKFSGRLIAFQVFRCRLLEQGAIGGFHQVRRLSPDELRRVKTNERGSAIVGHQNLLVMDENDLRQSAGKIDYEVVDILYLFVPFAEGVEQFVDCRHQGQKFPATALRQAAAHHGICRHGDHLIVQR